MKQEILEAFINYCATFKEIPTREVFILDSEYTRREIDREFGSYSNMKNSALKGRTLEDLINFFKRDEEVGDEEVFEQATVSQTEPGKMSIEARDIRTLEELIAYTNTDTDKWEAKKFSVTSWKGDFGAKAEFVKKEAENNVKLLLEKFVEDSSHFAPARFLYQTPSKDKDCLYVLNIQDLHLAKLAWDKETGNSYNIEIAKEVFNNAVNDLMWKAPRERIEEVIVICGSDFFQCDNEGATTSGTYVDTDSRLTRAFEEGVNLLTSTIEDLAQDFKVRVMCYPGNHDTKISFYAGHYLSAWFKNHENVFIDSSPKSRKYYGYGKTLLSFTHGNEEKISSLALIILREQMAEISKYKYIEALTGHFHTESVTEQNGVKIRVASSLSAEDSWHKKKGFSGNIRTSQGLLYNKENGIEAIYYSTPVQ